MRKYILLALLLTSCTQIKGKPTEPVFGVSSSALTPTDNYIVCSGLPIDSLIQQGKVNYLSDGKCVLTQTLLIGVGTSIIGNGKNRTNIHADHLTDALVFVGTGEASGFNLTSKRSYQSLDIANGITINANSVSIKDILIRGFTTGVWIYGSAENQGTNANHWRMDSIDIIRSGWAGVYVDGPDSNAGAGYSVMIQTSCYVGTGMASLGVCASLIDSSFLGNTWVAAHTATAKDSISGEVFGSYIFDGDNQRSVCIGCYSESNQLPGIMAKWTNILGGIGNWTGKGMRMVGPQMSAISVPNGEMELRAGSGAAVDSGLEIHTTGLPTLKGFRIKQNKTRGDLNFNIANLGAGDVVRINPTIPSIWVKPQ